ncbi:sulfurtransferase [Fodinibius sp.]|uniref:sulfurtransferase n=1 Tax=Fodinibius sp. TaxID=1872440 RepID=UPI002ACE9F59|nr:rhodanese-like domain-containing protein [Fodinibius sp.]MDZ7657681.1 rhodanese-like domain-containing protein [Fodinibius sp.]
MENIAAISTSELQVFNEKDVGKVIDVRPIAAYNGWRLQDENRGGHIPKAKSIPLEWTRYMDWVEVLEEKNIRKTEPVVVYGYNAGTSQKMAEKLLDLDYQNVSVYNDFVEEWLADTNLPLDRLQRYHQLVHPEWVKQLVDGEKPQEYDSEDYVICHSHYGYIEDYEKGHIPGAIALNTNWLESTETWNRRSPEELRNRLESLGIRHDTTVVVYGRFSAPVYDEERFPGKSAGHLGAMRSAAILLYAGVEDVRILNGGITSWELAGYELSTEEVTPNPVDDFGTEIPGRPELMIDTPQAKEYLSANDAELVSVRSWQEFIGERSGYHYIEKKGRIPGAVFGNCGSDAYHMENYRNFDHTMREYQEVAEKWIEEGLTPDKKLAFYCGTGWRGSEAFWNAWLMGWPKVSVYDGGWYEWSSDPSNPIERGEPLLK